MIVNRFDYISSVPAVSSLKFLTHTTSFSVGEANGPNSARRIHPLQPHLSGGLDYHTDYY